MPHKYEWQDKYLLRIKCIIQKFHVLDFYDLRCASTLPGDQAHDQGLAEKTLLLLFIITQSRPI